MPDYVYALHDFLPEHEDEVTFHTGERIEVVERDDLYGDGWWQGKNLAGKTGLFPQSYTSKDPPAPSTEVKKMASVSEESEAEAKPPSILVNGATPGSTEESQQPNQVMKETMTDVQKAIEQLGRGRNAEVDTDDGARSMDFSFASSKDGNDTDTDFETSDADGEDGEDWHKGARQKLAEKARKAVADAEEMEKIMQTPSGSRLLAPPIQVEMSDESEDEEDDDPRPFSRISEADEDDLEEQNTTINGSGNSTIGGSDEDNHVTLPPRDETEVSTAVAATFPEPITEKLTESPELVQVQAPTPAAVPTPPLAVETAVATPPTPVSPSPLSNALTLDSKHSSLSTKSTGPLSPLSKSHSVEPPHPADWSEAEVVDWLKSKGFDQDICDKFAEQEITGDVLLELDVNLLKSEIGILPFGKRMRIANAITDLRRPPSIVYSETQKPNVPIPQPLTPSQTNSQHSHSRNQSFGYTPSWQGSVVYAGSQSLQAGLISPESAPHTGDLSVTHMPDLSGSDSGSQSFSRSHSRNQSQGQAILPGEDGLLPAIGLGDANGKGSKARPAQLTFSPSDGALAATAKAVSDIPEETETEDRGAVSENEATAPNNTIRRRLFGRDSASKRDSAASGGSSPGYMSSPAKGTDIKEKDVKEKDHKDKDKDNMSTSGSSHHRPRKSVDNNHKPAERTSIFGGFGGTIGIGGKGRKPVPRYSAGGADDSALSTDKHGHSSLSLGRLYGSKKGQRPSTSDGISTNDSIRSRKGTPVLETPPVSPRANGKEAKDRAHSIKEVKDPAVLRKRTTSIPPLNAAVTTEKEKKNANTNGLDNLKAGQSILSQIGEPDHVGFMRKKGDRYNAWKQRYFVLKGSHMYCLKNNNPNETRIKGYINIVGYKVVVDENVDPGRYGFKIVHDNDKTHFFSSDQKTIVRDWMKAIMKATIGRDYTRPVVSSCNIPTIPLMVAQAMNPAPRPPSPTARDATQKALRREHPDQLSSRDARVLMGLPSENKEGDRSKLGSGLPAGFEDVDTPAPSPISRSSAPPRPSREGRPSSTSVPQPTSPTTSTRFSSTPLDEALIDWANAHLPSSLRVEDASGPLYGGLAILRLAESIKGRPTSPPVLDSAFPSSANDDKLDGLFRLFDFLLDNDVKMGSVSINDIRQGKRDKVVQLLRALKTWEDKRKAIAQSIGKGSVQAGAFMAPVGSPWS